jgi:hypothetical protein
VAVVVGLGVLIDHRRYRGVPVPPGLTGRARGPAIRQGRAALGRAALGRAALGRYQTPPRDTGYEGYRQ